MQTEARPSERAPAQASRLPAKAPEILAPAGGRAQFFAALNAGADAVYLGLKAFNARSRAENFSPDDLRELLPLARERGMRVLVTLNILVKDVELPALIDTMATLEELEVDAIIVQDLAVAKIAREHFPGLRLHASTQMAVHNLAGVKEAVQHGFRRVVLARELTAQELRKIRSGIAEDEVEIEAFCHGSLCYSYSGLCFFSGAEDARSGNRGECAYTCRQPYEIVSEPGHGFLFSMRDLDTSHALGALVESGVDTLKIEGRKKDAQYVAASVKLYRRKLDELFGRSTGRGDGTVDGARGWHAPEADLAFSFQRRPTSFFLKGRYHENVIDLDNPTHTGARVGVIEAVRGRRIAFRAEAPLERFDGLRLVQAGRVYHSTPQDGAQAKGDTRGMHDRYEGRLAEFSLRELSVDGRRAAEATAGALVEVELPDGVATPLAGDLVHKTRSADLKRRVEKLSSPPADARLKPLRWIDVAVTAEPAEGGLVVSVTAEKLGVPLATVRATVPATPSTGRARLEQDARDLFRVIGDAGFAARSLRYDGDPSWFVPRSKLKELKATLAEGLGRAYDAFVEARKAKALTAIAGATPVPLVPRTRSERRFAIKSDRLETLEAAARYAARTPDFVLDELVFEPKRAFLPDLDPASLATRLAALRDDAGAKVRLAVPTVMRAWDEPLLKRWFTTARQKGLASYEVGNLGAFELLRAWGLLTAEADLASDFTLYALNSVASTLWAELGVDRVALSVEDDRDNVAAHVERLPERHREKLTTILYKDTPLFIAEACSLTALHDGCPTSKVCGYRSLTVKNPKGELFHVAHESCKSIVYGDDAYSITHRQDALLALGLTRFRIDFLTRPYDEERLTAILEAARTGEKLAKTHAANFDRRLL